MKKIKWILLVCIFLVVLFCGLNRWIASSINSEIRNGRQYIIGVDAFYASARAKELLGDHLNVAKGDPQENSREIGNTGTAQIELPVAGDKRSGILDIKASEQNGVWQVDELSLRLDGETTWESLSR